MFPRISTIVSVLFCSAILAAATPKPWDTTTVTVTAEPTATEAPSQCNTGPVQCCDSTQTVNDPVVTTLLGLLGIGLAGVDLPIALTCNPIIGENTCSSNAVCCENNNFNGAIAFGCVPVNLNL